jgi:predicted ArsR family transcriptional regulator
MRMLTAEGHVVEVSENGDGQLVLRKRSCPFISMFEDTRTVCEVDRDLITDLVGAPIRQIACRHDGSPCCAFELASAENSHP